MLFLFIHIVIAIQDCSDQYQQCLNHENCIIKDCQAILFVETSWNFTTATFQNISFNFQNHLSDVGTFSIVAKNLKIQDSDFDQILGENLVALQFLGDRVVISGSQFQYFERIYIKATYVDFDNITLDCNTFITYADITIFNNTIIQCHFYKCLGEHCLCNNGLCDLNKQYEVQSFQQIPTKLEQNFTFGVSSNQTEFINTKIIGSSIGIYANQSFLKIDQKSLLYASGLGCQVQQGYGCGFYDWMLANTLRCGSSGASHGGFGGKPKSQVEDFSNYCQNLIPRQIYGNPFNPLFEGSGGGGKYFGGNGGGVIYLQAENITIDGRVESNGKEPDRDDSIVYGGGSGGSIQMRGKLYGEGYVSSVGGSSSTISGEGGGGRIYFDDPLNHNLKITTGSNLKQQGTIYFTPCPQGFGLMRSQSKCVRCSSGYYSYLSSTLECKQCLNSDDSVEVFEESISPICKILTCKQGKVLDNQQCVQLSIIKQSGGENIVFAIGILIFLLIFNFIIFLCSQKHNERKRVESQSLISVTDFQQDQQQIYEAVSQDPKFLPEDLPYYVKRFFIQGNNTPNFPWLLNEKGQMNDFFLIQTNQNQQDQYFIKHIIKNINQFGQYTTAQSIILIFFKIWYFPFYYILLKRLQKKKAIEILRFMNKNNKINVFCLKISFSQDYTLAYIDVLNYNNNILDWNKSTQFPISLVLQGDGYFLFPWQINLKDPLVKSMKMSFEKQKIFLPEVDSGSEEDLSSDEDEIRSFDEFITKFNLLMLQIDINKGSAEFLKNCFSLFEFIDESNREIFNKKQILLEICFHILGVQQSSLIILTTEKFLDFQQTLRELHQIVNYKPEYQIKVSVNFEKQDFKIKSYYNNQIVINTINDINKQITMYQRYEEDKEELNNLKLQMQRKIEADGILTPLLVQKLDEEEESNEIQSNSANIVLLKIKRFITITFAYLLRYRENQYKRIVTLGLLFCCILQIPFYIIYLLDLLFDVSDYNNTSSITMFRFEILECVTQFTFFPIAQFITQISLIVWLLNPEKKYFGKNYLVFNFCSTICSFFLAVFAIFECAIIAIKGLDSVEYIIVAMKISLFLIHLLQGYLGTQFLQN